MKDYYKILEVNKDASFEIIAKVYKILAKKYHPDLQDDTNKAESAEKFKEISEAYETLSNEEKRRNYDEQLEAVNQQNSIDISDYENLKNYCVQLESELNQLKTYYNNDYSENTYSPRESENSQRVEQQYKQQSTRQSYNDAMNKAYNDAVNKAYHDAYVNNLKSMGYKIRYKKSFKEQCKGILSIIITALIMYIIIKIIWTIPSLKNMVMSYFTI